MAIAGTPCLKRLSGAALLAACLAAAGPARGACYVDWNCGGSAGCASVYGAPSGHNGPFASCDGFKQVDQVGHCTCSGGAVAAPATYQAPSGLTSQQQLGMQMGALGAQMIMQGLQGALNSGGARPPAAAPGGAPDRDWSKIQAEHEAQLEDSKRRLREKFGGDGSRDLSFRVDDDAQSAERACEDSCGGASQENDEALAQSRREAASLLTAMPKADFEYGLGLAQTEAQAAAQEQGAALEKLPPVDDLRDGQDRLTVQRDYNTTIGDLLTMRTRDAARATSGELTPAPKSLLESTDLKERAELWKGRYADAKDWAAATARFHAQTMNCVNGPEATFANCMKSVNDFTGKIFDALMASDAALAAQRVKAARDEYEKYAGGLLQRAEDQMTRSQCLAECRK